MTGRSSGSTTAGRRRSRVGQLALGLLVVIGSGLFLVPCESGISNLRRCYDPECSVVVSKGHTHILYNAKDEGLLSFRAQSKVDVYSKEAGDRMDLWGVKIGDKRGYVPKHFIRETQIIHKNLEYIVPTEKYEKKLASSNQSTANIDSNIPSTVQDKISTEAFNKSDEVISPDPPSYEYDGTIIPRELTEEISTQPSSTIQTPNDVKVDDEVELKVYPNIFSSTFSTLSNILGGKEETSEDKSSEVTSSESTVNEQTTEITPTIEKADESSPESEEKQDLPETTSSEKNIVNVINDQNLEKKIDESVGETDPETKLHSDSDESKITEENVRSENAVQNKGEEINVDTEEQVKSVEEIELVLQNETNEELASIIENINVDKSSKPDIEDIKSEPQEPQDQVNNAVPKSEEVVETVPAITEPSNIENDTEVIKSEETIVDEQVDLNNIVNFTKTEDIDTSEVPSTPEIKEEIVSKPSESFIPHEEAVEPSLFTNESTPIESTKSNEDSSNVIETDVQDSKPADNENVNLEKQLEVNNSMVDSNNDITEASDSVDVPLYLYNDSATESSDFGFQSVDTSEENISDTSSTSGINEFLLNRNLLNVAKDSEEIDVDHVVFDKTIPSSIIDENKENSSNEQIKLEEQSLSIQEESLASDVEKIVLPPDTCDENFECSSGDTKHQYSAEANAVTSDRKVVENSDTLLYVCITAVTTLLFSLGYYFIENKRRDAYLISKINNLEKDLMITRKECIMLDENFKSTKTKLDSIEDESFGSNEMVLSLKDELAAAESAKEELKEQIASLERELESTSEAGLELERMLREILASQNEENNPLAQSIQDLQDRLNDQQNANVSLTNALALKNQELDFYKLENETLTGDLTVSLKKVEQLQAEVTDLAVKLETETNLRINSEQTLSEQVQKLELTIKTLTDDKSHLRKQLKKKELELKELMGVVEQMNSNNLDIEKLYEVSHIKAEAAHLLEERDELKMKLSEEEGAHQLLEEHVKLVREEVANLSEQCKLAEKEKKDAETRLEVLTKFFEEKEAQRQKDEALWLEKQGEVSSTVERIQTMQTELLNYKQQVEMLKREILDQEREYKNQISALETKAHEHWVAARQNERRLEEIKAESSQLRNRLTLVEKNISDNDPEVKLHRRKRFSKVRQFWSTMEGNNANK